MDVAAGVNPNYPITYPSFHVRRRAFPLPSPSLKFQPLLPPPPVFLQVGLPSFAGRKWVLPLASSHQDSNNAEVEVEKDKELGPSESEEAWKQALEFFKDQALKMQSISHEAYEVYSQKAVVILKETSVQLNIQAEKARNDLALLAKELSVAAENSPEPVKEIVESYHSSTHDVNDVAKVRDFHVGIPYGLLLSVGGFLSFMLTGSISAVRFGVILGGALLGLSIWSLKSYKKGESLALALRGQAAIAAIIFLREIQQLAGGASFFSFLATIISGAAVAFFFYRIRLDNKQSGNPNTGYGTQSTQN